MMVETGSALLVVFLGPRTWGSLSLCWMRGWISAHQALHWRVRIIWERCFYALFLEDLERSISFPGVRELNGRIRILKSGIVPTRPRYLLDCLKYVCYPLAKIISKMNAVHQGGISGDHGVGGVDANPLPPHWELSGIAVLSEKWYVWSAFCPAAWPGLKARGIKWVPTNLILKI